LDPDSLENDGKNLKEAANQLDAADVDIAVANP